MYSISPRPRSGSCSHLRSVPGFRRRRQQQRAIPLHNARGSGRPSAIIQSVQPAVGLQGGLQECPVCHLGALTGLAEVTWSIPGGPGRPLRATFPVPTGAGKTAQGCHSATQPRTGVLAQSPLCRSHNHVTTRSTWLARASLAETPPPDGSWHTPIPPVKGGQGWPCTPCTVHMGWAGLAHARTTQSCDQGEGQGRHCPHRAGHLHRFLSL